MADGLSAPGTEAPAALPAAMALAVQSARPMRVAGGQPVAAVVLIEIDTKGMQ